MSNETCPPLPSLLKASKISTTVPKSPIKGEVEAMMLRNESPEVACFRILFFQIARMPGVALVSLKNIASCGSLRSPRKIDSSDSCSSLDILDIERYLYKKIHKVMTKYSESQQSVIIVMEFDSSKKLKRKLIIGDFLRHARF